MIGERLRWRTAESFRVAKCRTKCVVSSLVLELTRSAGPEIRNANRTELAARIVSKGERDRRGWNRILAAGFHVREACAALDIDPHDPNGFGDIEPCGRVRGE